VFSGDYTDLLLWGAHYHGDGSLSIGGAAGDWLRSGYGGEALPGAMGLSFAGHLGMASGHSPLGTVPTGMGVDAHDSGAMLEPSGHMQPG
jgi:hypothetical protein